MAGGISVGPSHAGGGIPMVVESTNEHVELEGSEFVLNKDIINKTDVLELNGTALSILEQIAKKYGSPTGKLTKLEGGEWVICKKVVNDTKHIKVKGTVKQIINKLQLEKGCKIADKDGRAIDTTPIMGLGGFIANSFIGAFETLFYFKY